MSFFTNNVIKLPYRYDFFTIWGNGLEYTDDIIRILRAEENLEIIRIESRRIHNMRNFVFNLYACDTVPIEHLHWKLEYLFDTSPNILIIYVKNLAPEELPVGVNTFRHVQCQYINRIKWRIRELYNPHINGDRTEDHVIHASDYEEQVDYFLKLSGQLDGVNLFEGDSEGLPFKKPYYIKRPETYIFKILPLHLLRATILHEISDSKGNKTTCVETPITETPHYRSLLGSDDYVNYYEKYKYKYLIDDHDPEKLSGMTRLSNAQITTMPPILVKKSDDHYIVLDGVHRASITMYREIKQIKCVEFV